MPKDWVQYYSDTTITIVGLFIFLLVFAGAVFTTYHRGRKSHFEKMETLPLE